MKVTEVIADIERMVGVLTECPDSQGTQLHRILVDAEIVRRDCPEVVIPPGRHTLNLWCLGAGLMGGRKLFYYGDTIPRVLRKAHKGLGIIITENGK